MVRKTRRKVSMEDTNLNPTETASQGNMDKEPVNSDSQIQTFAEYVAAERMLKTLIESLKRNLNTNFRSSSKAESRLAFSLENRKT
ncbi:unnamed protein product [Prunus armeniaca]